MEQLLNNLKEQYSFQEVSYRPLPDLSHMEFSFRLNEEHINKFIEKAGRLNSIVESCANMVSFFEPDLKDTLMETSVRCCGANELCIRTPESMIKLLVETLFD